MISETEEWNDGDLPPPPANPAPSEGQSNASYSAKVYYGI